MFLLMKILYFNRSSFLKSPVVSLLAMTKKRNVHTLQNNATLRFRIKVIYYIILRFYETDFQ